MQDCFIKLFFFFSGKVIKTGTLSTEEELHCVRPCGVGQTSTRRLQASPEPLWRRGSSAPLQRWPSPCSEAHSLSLRHQLTDRHRWCPPAFQLGPLPGFAHLLLSKMIPREGRGNDGSALMDLPESGQSEQQTDLSYVQIAI